MAETRQRTVVVTGGEMGIGRAIVERILADGDRVLSIGMQADEPMAGVSSLVADLTQPTELSRAAEAAAEAGATALVHNAGVIRPALLPDVTDSDLDYVVDLHLRAPLHLVQAILPAMQAAGDGRVVLISSRGAGGLQTRSVYSATKAGLIGMGRTWALELAPLGVTVNIVSPGPVETDMFHALIPPDSPRKALLAQAIPAGRLAHPRDVAQAVAFFLDGRSDFITGQNLLVCGGASIGSLTV